MKKVRLTESELVNLIKNVVMEQSKEKVTGQFRPLVNRPKMESEEMDEEMELDEAGGKCPKGQHSCFGTALCCDNYSGKIVW